MQLKKNLYLRPYFHTMLHNLYPAPTTTSTWKLYLTIGFFISLFLLVFQPFGLIAYHDPNKYWFIGGYGLVTFVVLTLDNLLLKLYFQTKSGKKDWTVARQIVMQVMILFTIGAGNYFYSAWNIHFYNPYIGFLVFQAFTTAVGLLPISIITILNENIRNKAFLKEAYALNQIVPATHTMEMQSICLTGEGEKNSLILPSADFLYAESSGNYLDVRYVLDGKVKSTLLRTTLTRAESQLESHPDIMKCHRAFLVNIANIEQAKGNAQGLRLQLKHTDDEIPVSRNYINDLRDKMKS